MAKGFFAKMFSNAAQAAEKAARDAGAKPLRPERDSNEPDEGWYPVKVVGESRNQTAIGQLKVGDWVDLVHDVGNKFDDRAIKVMSEFGKIGYLERESWLGEAVIDVGWEVPAKVLGLYESRDFPTGVVLQAKLDRPALREAKKQMRAEKRAAAKAAKQS